MRCDTRFNSRPVVSENGIHYICCLHERTAFNCMIGKKDRYIRHPMLKEADGK